MMADEFDDYDDFDDFEEDYDDSFDFDDDMSLDDDYEDIDLFGERPLKVDSNYDVNALEVHVSFQLTSRKIIELMDTYPSLRRITCPKSIYDRISPKYLEALEGLGVSVEVKYNWGRKNKYSQEEIDEVIDLLNQKKSPEDVADTLEIPLSRVNYFKSKYHDKVNVKNYNRKYNQDLRNNIKSLHCEGFKPKEIAEQKNIPLRSVYYILNNK